MSLDNVLTELDTVRDTLVSTVNEKGAELTSESTLYEINAAIAQLSGGGGSSMKFYQCTAVDTDSKTWSGKELVLTDGVYVVSDTETTGLLYGSGFTPVVGKVYSEDVLIAVSDYWRWAVSMPTDTAFDIPLDQTSKSGSEAILPYPDYGSTWYAPALEYMTHQKVLDGVTCLYFADRAGYLCTGDLFAVDDTTANETTGCSARYGSGYPWTYSFWIYPDSTSDNGARGLFLLGYHYSSGGHRRLCLRYNDTDGTFCLFTSDNDSVSSGWVGYAAKNKWHHICVTADTNAQTFKLYVDGVHITSITNPSASVPTQPYTYSPTIYIGGERTELGGSSGDLMNTIGGYAKLKWFNRVLDQGEISALASDINA